MTLPPEQIMPEAGAVQAPSATQEEPTLHALVGQPQSAGQMLESSPQSQVPLPQEETIWVPMQMVPVAPPQVPSAMQVPGAV
jgi:hypothetical protein